MRRRMNPGSRARKAKRRERPQLSYAFWAITNIERMNRRGSARLSAAQGIDAAIKYCAPWRRYLRAIAAWWHRA